MEKKIKLSIVIPAYNVSKYLEKCVMSCVESISHDGSIEILIINDGSTDNTLTIAEELREKYGIITVYSKANGGLSSARNLGIDKAQGEFVFFLDADDYLDKNAIPLITEAIKDAPDVIGLNYSIVYEYNEKKINKHFYAISTRELLISHAYPMGAQFWVVKNDFLKSMDLRFTLNIYHEDNEYTPRMLYLAKSMSIVSEPVYNYLIRQSGSIISSKNIKKSYDLLGIISMYFSFMKKHVDSRDYPLFYDYCMLAFNSCCANAREHSRKDKEVLMEYMLEKKDILDFSLFIKANTIKYKLESLCALVNRRLLYRIMLKL